jgi:hypothetical protein
MLVGVAILTLQVGSKVLFLHPKLNLGHERPESTRGGSSEDVIHVTRRDLEGAGNDL